MEIIESLSALETDMLRYYYDIICRQFTVVVFVARAVLYVSTVYVYIVLHAVALSLVHFAVRTLLYKLVYSLLLIC